MLLTLLVGSKTLGAQSINPSRGVAFQDSLIPRIDLFLPLDSLALILAPGNENDTHEYHTSFIFSDGVHFDTLTDVGFRLRGNTSKTAQKKSYKLSFNTYEPGRKWRNLEKLNLNGEHNDPSISRAKICWDFLRELDIPSCRANHIDLYINGQYFGVYLNVENIDEQFTQLRFGNNNGNLYKCLYPADLVFTGDNQALYKTEIFGRRPYELQNNTSEDDYSDLVQLIKILNTTPPADLPCALEKVLNVDNVIRLLVFDVLTGNWDGPVYNKNNFYLYKDQKSGKFEMMAYDVDNTLGIDFLNTDWTQKNIYSWKPSNENRPIYSKILAVKSYKDRFSYYFDQAINIFFNKEYMLPVLESLKNKLSGSAQADLFRTLDYGFTFSDFQQSFTVPLPYSHTPEGILSYIEKRGASIKQQLILNPISPIIKNTGINQTFNSNILQITTSVQDDNPINKVEFCYTIDQMAETCVSLSDNGLDGDQKSGDGIYSLNLSVPSSFTVLRYKITATDSDNNITNSPYCDRDTLLNKDLNSNVVINEVMADNKSILPDEYGDFDDWVELYNTSDNAILLKDYFMSDKKSIPGKWPLPEISIPAKSFLLIWADDEVDQGDLHAAFKLNDKGEYLGLFEKINGDFILKDEIDFKEVPADLSYGRYPNGNGPFQKLKPTPLAFNSVVNSTQTLFDVNDYYFFPNPAKDEITLRNQQGFKMDSRIKIYDVLGQAVADYRISNESEVFPIDTKQLKSGIYQAVIIQPGISPKGLSFIIQR